MTKTSDGFPNPSFGGKGPFAKGLTMQTGDNSHRAFTKSSINKVKMDEEYPKARGLAASMKIARQKVEKDCERGTGGENRSRLGGGD